MSDLLDNAYEEHSANREAFLDTIVSRLRSGAHMETILSALLSTLIAA